METQTPQFKYKFSHEIPAIYPLLQYHFGADWDKGVVITYGDTIYSKNELTNDLITHELVHVRQQAKFGAEAWWKTYIAEVTFRKEQEREAYQQQMKYLKTIIKDRNTLARQRHILAMDMVRMYKGAFTFSEAMNLLK